MPPAWAFRRNAFSAARASLAGMLAAIVFAMASAAVADPLVWQALRGGGHAILIRHAEAPGTGDPPGFRLGDCATQRNLSDDGRAQARAIGEAFRSQHVRVDGVASSRWCRGLETARLLELGPVVPTPSLDSFFRNRELEPSVVAALLEEIGRLGNRTVVMVTHQVNITALTGIFPASGEVVVVAPGEAPGAPVRVVGRLMPGR
jgi:phosphohistidine phosphatase SixA